MDYAVSIRGSDCLAAGIVLVTACWPVGRPFTAGGHQGICVGL